MIFCFLFELFFFLKRFIDNLIGINIILRDYIKRSYIIFWRLFKKILYN